jgi:hypothetical protein
MLKKGDDEDEVDDAVRTTVLSQNYATAALSTEELSSGLGIYNLPSYQQRGVGGGGDRK